MDIFRIAKDFLEDYKVKYKIITTSNYFIFVVFEDQFLGELFEAMYSLDSVSERIIL